MIRFLLACAAIAATLPSLVGRLIRSAQLHDAPSPAGVAGHGSTASALTPVTPVQRPKLMLPAPARDRVDPFCLWCARQGLVSPHDHESGDHPDTALTLPDQPAGPPAAPVAQDHPPDPLPEVTPPEGANPGGVRRPVQPPPCHGCVCCRAYAARMEAAHREIDRLRDELVAADGRRINHPSLRLGSDTTIPFGGRQ